MNKNVLVVDDDQLILYGLARALKQGAYKVQTASSATMAVDKLGLCPYDLCLVDLHLPDLNGIELMRIIKDICPRTRIIVMTASCADFPEFREHMAEAIQNGACHFIPKPFNLSEVTEIIDRTLTGEGEFHPDLMARADEFFKTTRRSNRKPHGEPVNFWMTIIEEGEARRKRFAAKSVDIGEEGIGLLSRYPLMVSQVVGFEEELEYRSGVVVWSTLLDNQTCRAGIKFAW